MHVWLKSQRSCKVLAGIFMRAGSILWLRLRLAKPFRMSVARSPGGELTEPQRFNAEESFVGRDTIPSTSRYSHDEEKERICMAEPIVLLVNGKPHNVEAEAETPEVLPVAGEK